MNTLNFPPHTGPPRVGDIIQTRREDLGPRWAPCDGRLADQNAEPDLYAAIGTTFNRREWVWDQPRWIRRLLPRRWRRGHLEYEDLPGQFRFPDYQVRGYTQGVDGEHFTVRHFIYLGSR